MKDNGYLKGSERTGLARKKAVPVSGLMKLYVMSMGLAPGLNCRCVYRAWDKVTGLGKYTLDRFYKDGVLYCTISSSVVRSQLSLQKKLIIDRINDELANDGMFTPGVANGGTVKSIVLK